MCSGGFLTETACYPQFKLKVTKITICIQCADKECFKTLLRQFGMLFFVTFAMTQSARSQCADVPAELALRECPVAPVRHVYRTHCDCGQIPCLMQCWRPSFSSDLHACQQQSAIIRLQQMVRRGNCPEIFLPLTWSTGLRVSASFQKIPSLWVNQGEEQGLVPVFKKIHSLWVNQGEEQGLVPVFKKTPACGLIRVRSRGQCQFSKKPQLVG